MDGGSQGGMRQPSVASAAEQTGGDSRAPSFTAVIRSSRTGHHMGWHNLFIQSLDYIRNRRGGGVCLCVFLCAWEDKVPEGFPEYDTKKRLGM